MICESEEKPIVENDLLDNVTSSYEHCNENSVESPDEITDQVTTVNIFKSNRRRWLVLFAMFVWGFSLAITEVLAPVLEVILDLLSTDLKIYTWIVSACSYIPLVTTLPTAWIVDKWGLKVGIYTGVVLTLLRNGLRALFFLPDLPFYISLRYFYFVISTIINQQVVTLFFCLPLKVSETWFKEKERFTAWAVIYIGFEIGYAIAAYMMPIYITNRYQVYLLAYLNLAVALTSVLIVSICVRDSKPPTPPSNRVMISSNSTISYRDGIKIMLSNKDFMIHSFFLTCREVFPLAISPILQDILKTANYDNQFCGQLMSIGAISGSVFLFVSSYSVLIIKTSLTGVKILACLSTVAIVLYFQAIQLRDHKWLIISSSLFTAFLGSTAKPCFANMSAHLCSGFVREATISGFSTTSVMFLNSIFSLIVVYMKKKTSDGEYSYGDSMMFLSVCSIVVAIFYLLLFRGQRPKPDSSIQNNCSSQP